MTKSFTKRLHRAIAVVMSVAMLVGTLPADLLGGIASVKAAESMVLNASDASTVSAFTALGALGTDIGQNITIGDFKVLAAADATVKLTTNNKSIDGFSFTHRLQLGGAGGTTKRSISFTTNGAANVVMYGMSSSSNAGQERNVVLADSDGTEVDRVDTVGGSAISKQEFTVDSADTYYLFSESGGFNVYYVEVTPIVVVKTETITMNASDADFVSAFTALGALGTDIGQNITVGDFEVLAASDATVKLTTNNKSIDGFSFTHRLQLGGAGGTTKRSVSFTTKGEATITAYGMSSSSNAGQERNIILADADGTEVDRVDAVGGSAISRQEFTVDEAGTYYLFSESGGFNLYYVSVTSTYTGSGDGEDKVPVQATFDVSDPDALLETTGGTITLKESKGTADGEDITDGGTFTLMSDTKYDLLTDNTDFVAKVDDQTSFTTGSEDAEYTVVVENTTVMVKPILSGEELGTNKLIAKTDKATYELKGGVAIKMPKNTTMTLEVRDAEGTVLETWLAKVDDAATFTTADKTLDAPQEVAVEITKVEDIQVTPTITGIGYLGDNTVYLVAGEEELAVVDGQAMTLKPMTEYTVVLEAEGVEATINASKTYTTGVEDAEITVAVSTPSTRTIVYDFNGSIINNDNKKEHTKGEILPGTAVGGTSGILYSKDSTANCKYDNQLRFRNGVILLLPIQDDTTKITYIQVGSNNNADRRTFIGSADSGYYAEMLKTESVVTVDDITPYIVEEDGQKYLPIVSKGDIKINSITLVEYNPNIEVTVSGTIAGAAEAGVTTVKFKNLDDADSAVVSAPVAADGTYSVVLKRVAGMTNYAATISVVGYKIEDANDADKFVLLGNDKTATVNLTVADSPIVTVNGKVTGINDLGLKGELGVTLIPDNPAKDPIELELFREGNGTYSFSNQVLDLNREYTVKLTNADDDEVNHVIKMVEGDEPVVTIQATAKPTYTVSGSFVTSDDKDSDVTKVTFTNMDTPKYTYSADVVDGKYAIKLRAGEYKTDVVSANYEPYDHVSVKDADVTNDVYLQGEVDTSAVAYEEEIKVGKDQKFTTITDAVEYISRMDRTATERVTIVLDKDVYREQVIIDTPNITIKGNGATVTWYYGFGFSYYSAKKSADGKDIFYDEAWAVDKYYMNSIGDGTGHWGATVNLLDGAAGFAAEDLTFENSLNRYMTEEELLDGADANIDPAVLPRTTENLDVRSQKAKERACVLRIEADNTEYKNCKLLSRQDTLYTGDNTESSYFKNCLIEGNVDFICGDGDAVFDACTLSMYGYSDAAVTAQYIVANKAQAEMGYLFDNCKIVNASTTDAGLQPTSLNILARAWDEGSVYWINTEVETADMIADDAYADMNGKSANANYNEYNTYYVDGTGAKVPVDTSKRTDVKIMTAEEAAAVKMTDFFGDWAPSYYEGEQTVVVDELALEITAPEALKAPVKKITTDKPGVILSNLTWYVGTEAFTGETFGGETAYTVKLTAKLAEKYAFSDALKVTVNGEMAEFTKAENGVVSITYTFPKTDKEGYYVLDLSNGLKKGVQYDGGITVMEDMAGKSSSVVTIDGVSYDWQVQGTNNPTPNAGAVPESGAVLVIEAIRDGVITVAIKSTGNKKVHFVSESGDDYLEEEPALNDNKTFKLPVEKGNTYYFYGDGTKIVYYSIIADYRIIDRAPWDTVDAPEITAVVVDGETYEGTADGEDGSTDGADDLTAGSGEIKVRVKGWVNDVDGADSVAVDMVDAKGNVVATKTSSKANDKAYPITDMTFKPTASGEYSFIPRLVRKEEADKVGKESKAVNFVLPMGHATIVSITNKFAGTSDGDDATGALEIAWNKVAEARKYEVIVAMGDEKLAEETVTGTVVTVGKLPLDKTVTVSVAAIGKDKDNKSVPSYETGDMMDAKVEKKNDRTWAFTAYGSSIALDNLNDNKIENNGYRLNEDGSVTVYSLNGKGKVVPGSTDGLAFYYTAMNPATENFTLTADVHVDQWTLSNGQDGFGLMVSDTVGKNGDGTAFWNNSYQLFSTKIEYNWDTNTKAVTNATAGENGVEKYSMKLGLGWIAKEGTTITDVAKITAGEQATPTNFSTTSGTLETSAALAGKGAGTYNIVGNATAAVDGTVSKITDFKLQIQRNNTGYILRYLDKEGNVLAEKIFYDDDANKMTQIDKKNIYVGFVASRNAQITVSNIKLDTINPADDAEPMEKEVTKVDPSYQVLSSKTANSEKYELVYYGNVDGKLTIIDANDNVVANGIDVTAKKKYSFRTTLNKGDNKYELVIVPDKNYVPGENQIMSNYDKREFSFHVEYQEFANDIIYVAPAGKATNAGTKESPVDIYTAVAYAKAGQKIYLVGGTYRLTDPILIDRGHDGTEENPIYLMADPSDIARPVFNFIRQTEATSALTLAGNYWYLKGFDVTESLDAQKGVLVAGNYNVLEDIDAYKNGNTGIQLSRYLGTDSYDQWPAYNTILNCTSYLNADAGYEDADGFACKLTTADGNKFVGCIAAYNADDGWDLYAKVQSGSIGAVTIDSCIAFMNGYVIGYDTDGDEKGLIDVIDENGTVGPAGNGNGFKMGGDSMSGYHVIKNSVAFANKAKGIDSNSCPDIQVYNCTSFNNESYNVALYTNTAVKTDYYATGILSIKNSNKVAEQIKPVGSQNLSKIYSTTNYYFDGKKSVNSVGDQASLDWFKSIDVNAAISGAGAIYREADGSINMNGFLELTDKAPANVGARLGNTSAAVVLEKAAEVSVYANTVKKLSDIDVPVAGYDWKYPNTDTAVFAGTSAEFIISAEGKEDKAVVVNFVEVTGVALSANGSVLVGSDKVTLTATPVLTPAVDMGTQDGADYDYKFAGGKLSIDAKDNVATISRGSAKNGANKVTATMTATVGGKKVTKKATYTVTVSKGAVDITYTTDGADVVGGVITVDVNDTFTLKDVKAVGSIDGDDVKVSVNDSKVVKHDSKTNTFTAKAEGTATITMTAKADKSVSEDLIVVVRGTEFKTNVSTITVDKAKTAGAQITALGCYGAKVDPKSVSIKSVVKGKTDVTKYFAVEHVIGNVYNITTVADATGLAKGNYTMVLQGTTNGTAKDFEALTVKVTETKPTVKVKQTKKVNLFYTAGSVSNTGALTATSKQAKVTLTQTNADTSAYKLKSTKAGYSIVLKKAEAANAKSKNKIDVTVSYAGYKDTYNKKMTIKVATENKAPKLVLEVDNSVLYTKLGINDTAMRILDKTTNTYVTGADVKLADEKAAFVKANKNFELFEENGEYTLTTTKSGTAKISVQDADWTKAIVLNQKLTVNTKLPKATFKAVKLNSTPEYAGMEMASSEVTVKNALDYSVRDLELKGKNAKATALLEYLDYSVEITDEGKNVLNVSLNKALPVKANGKSEFSGTYTFDATFGLNKLAGQKATVKIAIVPKATITTKQSGSIDLVNRLGSSVTVKPTLKNLNGKVVGVKLNDDASNQFEVEWDSAKGAAVVTVKEDIDMKKGGKYKVTPTFVVETNGGDVEVAAKTITIKPKQSTVKTTKLEALETRLSAPQSAATAAFKATAPAKAEILEIKQITNNKNFKVTYDELSDTVSVKIINKAGLKAGTTYKVKVSLVVEGSAVNSKQQTVVLPVKVLK